MSLTAGIVIILVLLTRLLLKKAPKIFSYTLWAVVLFRLLCPVSISSELSLLGIFHSPTVTKGSITYVPTDIVHIENPQVDLPLPGISQAINESLPQGEVPIIVATFIWLCGITVMLSYSIASVLILRKRLKSARYTEQNIYEADNLKTPFVLGILSPRIFIPAGLAAAEKGYIIRHEQTHIRRFDHIIKPFGFLVLSIHWFNPLVWIAFIMMGTDMELSCDESVIKEMGSEVKKAYSASLLSLATGKPIVNGSPLAFGEGDVGGRIKNVLNYKKPAFWLSSAAIIIVMAVSISLMTNPKSNELTEATAFKTEETNLLEIGRIAFEEYMAVLMSDNMPDSDRIASYQLKDISALAGDMKEFCVSLNYDFTTDDDRFVNSGRGAKGKGTWPDNYLEIRIKNIDEYTYEIVSTGTGGGGQGLEPIADSANMMYTDEEIQAAMECVRKYFSEVATSRILNDLWFDEESCIKNRASYMQYGKGKSKGVSAENIIVLLCNFTIENDKAYYPNWQMVLIRDSADDAWRVDDQGV